MDMHHQTAFNLIAGGGLFLAAIVAWWAALRKRILVALGFLLLAILVLWFALIQAVGTYFTIWQQSPDPPDEAFADGAQLTGVLIAGWLPAGFVCCSVFLATRLVRHLRRGRGKQADAVAPEAG